MPSDPGATGVGSSSLFEGYIRTEMNKEHKPGDKVVMTWSKDGQPRDTTVTLFEQKTMVPHIRMHALASDLQRRIRESWLTGKQ